MKKSLLFALFLAAAAATAAESGPFINGTFADKGKGWGVLSAKFSVLTPAPEGGVTLTPKPDAPYADAGYSPYFDVAADQTVTVTAKAKGDGVFGVGIGIAGVGNFMQSFKLTPEYKTYTFQGDLKKFSAKLPKKALVKFTLANGKSVTIESISIKLEKTQ